MGKQVIRDEEHAVWSCYNGKTGEKYVALFNFKEEEQELTVVTNEIEQFYGLELKETAAVELWSDSETKLENGMLTAKVADHDAKIYLLK